MKRLLVLSMIVLVVIIAAVIGKTSRNNEAREKLRSIEYADKSVLKDDYTDCSLGRPSSAKEQNCSYFVASLFVQPPVRKILSYRENNREYIRCWLSGNTGEIKRILADRSHKAEDDYTVRVNRIQFAVEADEYECILSEASPKPDYDMENRYIWDYSNPDGWALEELDILYEKGILFGFFANVQTEHAGPIAIVVRYKLEYEYYETHSLFPINKYYDTGWIEQTITI